jgi:hypothetical protein
MRAMRFSRVALMLLRWRDLLRWSPRRCPLSRFRPLISRLRRPSQARLPSAQGSRRQPAHHPRRRRWQRAGRRASGPLASLTARQGSARGNANRARARPCRCTKRRQRPGILKCQVSRHAPGKRSADLSSGRSAHRSCPRSPRPSVDFAPSGPGTHGRMADRGGPESGLEARPRWSAASASARRSVL